VTITVEQLIEELKNCDPKHVVVMAGDGEGNSFRLCAGADGENQVFKRDKDRRGTIGLGELTPELSGLGYTDDDVLEGGIPCVVLWPV